MPKDIIESPDEAEYHKNQVEIDEKIDSLNDKIRSLSERFNEKLTELREGQSGRGELSKDLRDLYDELRQKNRER